MSEARGAPRQVLPGRVFPLLYDAVMGIAERGPVARWRGAVITPVRGRVLDVAAGTGRAFRHFDGRASVIAVEPDLAMLRHARPRAKTAAARVVLVAADAQALPFRGAAFDAAVVNLALCTIPRPPLVLAELRRVVRAGGDVRLLEHVAAHHPWVLRLQRWLTPLWRRVAGGCRLDRDTVGEVRRAGLVLEGVTAHARGWFVGIAARVPPAGADGQPDDGA
jgi:ubiquinone/menaquinone biosynthesis C-methylase UbiE